MSAPTVSVVMAAYNGAALLGPTLESLTAQTFGDFELVVVDDGSTDETRAVLGAWPDRRVRLIAAERNGGVVAARNRAVAEARGRYLAALDQDDLCHPERFARQVAYLDAHPDVVLLGTGTDILEDGALIPSALAPLSTPLMVEWLLRIENPLVWSSVMIRADAAQQLEPFQRPERKFAEDFDLYHRLSAHGRIARLDESLVTYRRHAGGASQVHVDLMRERATAVLADAYAPLLGAAAGASADLVTRHLMGHLPVPDRATLARLGDVLVRLQEDFFAQACPDETSRTLIRWETARRWARIGRIGLRAGHLSLGDATAVRPDHLGLGYAGVEELLMSRLVGGARVAKRKLAAGRRFTLPSSPRP